MRTESIARCVINLLIYASVEYAGFCMGYISQAEHELAAMEEA
jgi:hypothetical protein